MKMTIKGQEIDLDDALPITLGDMKAFEKLGLMTEKGEVSITGASGIVKVLWHFVKKINPKIKEADIEAVPISDIGVISEWVSSAVGGSQEPDRPS